MRQNKKEQYLKDEQELEQYLIESALEGAELKTNDNSLSGESLGNLAREMILNDAVIRRLAHRYDASILKAIYLCGEINLDSEDAALSYVEKLKNYLFNRKHKF